MLAIPLSFFLVFMLSLMLHLYLPQVGHLDLPEDLPPMLVLPGLDLETVAPLGLRVRVVVILTDCLAIYVILPETKEHPRIVTELKQIGSCVLRFLCNLRCGGRSVFPLGFIP